MIHTFDYLVQQAMSQTDERGDTDSTLPLMREYINAAHQLRCAELKQHFLVMDHLINTVVNVQDYSLHMMFDKPIYFYNRNTLQFLTETPARSLEDEGWNLNNLTTPQISGPAKDFLFWGHSCVKFQPTSGSPSVITVVSNNASDVGTNYQTAIKGIDLNDNLMVDLITPNGLTPVNGVIQFQKILALTKTGPTVGNLTYTSNGGTVTNVILTPNELGKQYRQIHLIAVPTASEPIEYRFYRKPLFLVNPYDIPDIPYPYSQILVYDALLNFAVYNTDMQDMQRIAVWKAEQEQWEKALQAAFKDSQTIGARSRYTRTVGSTWLGEEV